LGLYNTFNSWPEQMMWKCKIDARPRKMPHKHTHGQTNWRSMWPALHRRKKPIKFLVRNKYAYFEMQRFAAELGYYQNIYEWLIGDKIGLIFLGNLPVKDSKI